MTAEDRCTAEYPHPAHRTDYGPFGVKDCPGIPITPKNAPTVPDGPAPASTPLRKPAPVELAIRELERRVGQLEDRVDEHLTPSEYDPADDEDAQAAVQNLLDDSTKAFAVADTSSERVEVIRDLLAGWYAAWPSSAVTDPHEGIAWQLVSLINGAEARAATDANRLDAERRLLCRHLTALAESMTARASEADAPADGLAMDEFADSIRALVNHRANAESCPCLPGAPAHIHGAGGYAPTEG